MDLLAEEPPSVDPAANLALEEALARVELTGPALRLWQNTRCVVLGRGQQLAREVDLVACRRDGVPVLRRASGGGTVYQDLGTLNLTLAVPGRRPDLIGDVADLLAGAVARLGLVPVAQRRGLFVNAAKVAGFACQATLTGTVAHATLLVSTDPDVVSAYVLPSPPDPHPLDSQRSAVAALATLDPALGLSDVRRAALTAAEQRFGRLRVRPPREPERAWQERLYAARYGREAWHLHGRTSAA